MTTSAPASSMYGVSPGWEKDSASSNAATSRSPCECERQGCRPTGLHHSHCRLCIGGGDYLRSRRAVAGIHDHYWSRVYRGPHNFSAHDTTRTTPNDRDSDGSALRERGKLSDRHRYHFFGVYNRV